MTLKCTLSEIPNAESYIKFLCANYANLNTNILNSIQFVVQSFINISGVP